MADRVLPKVTLIFACDRASLAPDGKCELTNPWYTVSLPPGATFPFDVIEFWVYVQLAGGVGSFQVQVEMHLVKDDGSTERIARSAFSDEISFTDRLQARDVALRMTRIPFEVAGVYEFRALAGYVDLEGPRTQIRVLPAGGS